MKSAFLILLIAFITTSIDAQSFSLYAGTSIVDVRGNDQHLKSTGYQVGVEYKTDGDWLNAVFGGKYVVRPTVFGEKCEIVMPGSVEMFIGVNKTLYKEINAQVDLSVGWNVTMMSREFTLPEIYNSSANDFGPYVRIANSVGNIQLRVSAIWATDRPMPNSFNFGVGYVFFQ